MGLAPWIVAGVIAWSGVAWLGWLLARSDPPRLGFDLALLLDGARALLAGGSPYDASMVAGGSPSATDLFYSYPPPVAQVMQLVAWMPDGVVLVLWAICATAGLGTHRGGDRAPGRPGWPGQPGRPGWPDEPDLLIGLKAMLVIPLFLPFAIAVLFGNLDVWYPLAYGALLLTILARPSRLTLVAAGFAIGVVAIAKLHPGALLLWIGARAWVERGGPYGRVLAAAVVTGLAIVGASVLLGGIAIWQDYVAVVKAGAGADLVDPRNLGPVSLLGQATGMDAASLRIAQIFVTSLAAAVTVVAAIRVRDRLTSLAIAFTASLVVLPVTWYHYPVALIPVGLALAITRPSSRPLVVAAVVVAGASIAFPPLVWVAVAILLVACVRSGVEPHPEATAYRAPR